MPASKVMYFDSEGNRKTYIGDPRFAPKSYKGAIQGKKKKEPINPRIEKDDERKKAMEKFQLGKKYNIGGRAGYSTGKTVNEKRQRERREAMEQQTGKARKRKEEPYMILRTSVPEGPAKRYRTTKDFEIYKNQIDGTKIKLKKNGGRASYNSGGAIKVRDINKDGKKEGWEVARAKGMAKGMGKRLKMNSGGAVLKGKKVGCQIK